MDNLIEYSDKTLSRYFELNPRGLAVRGTPSIEAWIDAGEILKKAEGATQWWRGDWWTFGDHEYGEMAAQAVDDGDYKTLRNQAWVSSSIQLSRRRDNLSWSHHHAVASLEDTKEQDSWLDMAAKFDWAVHTLRTAIKESKNGTKPSWLRHTDVWNFGSCDQRFGDVYPGRIPGQIVLNLLHYYTEEEDLVIDPMAGGGVTEDACEHLNRRCISFDLQPSRPSIRRGDAILEWSVAEKAQLVFIDPPYWNQQDYAGARETYPGFLEDMTKVIQNAHSQLEEGGILAVLIAPMAIKTEKYIDIPFDIQREAEGFTLLRRISVPVSSQQVGPQVMAYCRDNNILVGLVRDLLVFEKN